MSASNESVLPLSVRTLPLSGLRASLYEILLIAAAVFVPVAAHLSGAPVRYLLPMHWPVILAGLVFGWRGGALSGFLAPVVSYALTGFPLPGILPSMTFELAAYGAIAGYLYERTPMNAFAATAVALVAGRIVFINAALLSNITTDYPAYFLAALVPGLAAGIAQIVLLPILANAWTKRERSRRTG